MQLAREEVPAEYKHLFAGDKSGKKSSSNKNKSLMRSNTSQPQNLNSFDLQSEQSPKDNFPSPARVNKKKERIDRSHSMETYHEYDRRRKKNSGNTISEKSEEYTDSTPRINQIRMIPSASSGSRPEITLGSVGKGSPDRYNHANFIELTINSSQRNSQRSKAENPFHLK